VEEENEEGKMENERGKCGNGKRGEMGTNGTYRTSFSLQRISGRNFH